MTPTAFDSQISRILASAATLPPAADEIEAGPCAKCDGNGWPAGTDASAGLLPSLCEPCEATGTVTAERADRWNAGSRLRQARILLRVGLRERAKALGLPPMVLSDIEHGRPPAAATTRPGGQP